MTKMLANIAVGLGIVILGGAITVGVVMARRSPDVERDRSAKVSNVEVLPIVSETVHDTIRVTGSLEPWKEVLLSSEAKGKIEWLGVEEGEKVNEGSDIVRVDRSSAEIRFKQAQIEMAMASMELNRIFELREKGIGSAQKYDQAKVDRDVAQSSLDARKMELDYTTIIAPFSGFVDEIRQETNEFVNVGTPILVLIQIHLLKMVVGIADQDVSFFSIGDRVEIVVDAYRDRTFSGEIYRIANALIPRRTPSRLRFGWITAWGY